jgi:shikimate dehydrogenase
VLGYPVRHSASPAMHNAALDHLGLDWRYLGFEVPPERLPEAIHGARAMRFLGLNLTVPHKLIALGLVDQLDESARRWGAVNTIRFEAQLSAGDWRPLGEFAEPPPEPILARGFNTDADAIIRALDEDLGLGLLAGKSVLLLGAGGAGRAAALRLADTGLSALYLVNRTVAKAVAVADEIAELQSGLRLSTDYPDGEVDLVINATSLGLRPTDELPFDPARFALTQARAVYDMIYQPAETRLLGEARRVGCQTANGLGMLLYQGARALELWTGRTAPVDVMRQALQAHVYGGGSRPSRSDDKLSPP